MNSAQRLASSIFGIPGEKIVTIAMSDMHQAFDVKGTSIGYAPTHAARFYRLLGEAIADGGAVIVRAFDSERRVSVRTPNGLKQVPTKRLYAVSCGRGAWKGSPAEEVRASFSVDADTGRPITPCSSEEFCDWPSTQAQ